MASEMTSSTTTTISVTRSTKPVYEVATCDEWPPLPGEFVKNIVDQHWYHACVKCGTLCSMAAHTIEPELLTVRPSVVCPACGAHYLVILGEVMMLS